MIKYLLLAVAAAATLFTANAAEPVVLWENAEGVTLNWGNGDINIAAEACSGFTLGGKIEVTIDKQEGCVLKLCYNKPAGDDGQEGGWTDLIQFALGSENSETASFTLLKSQVDIMKNYGFLPFGYNVTIHKIAYVPSDIEVDDNAIWIGPKSFKSGGFVEFPRDLFSNAKKDDKLVCMISEAENPFIKLLFGGWGGTEINNKEQDKNPERFTITENSITVTLTQEDVDKLKASGLVIQADSFVLDQLLLVPDNTTGSADLIIDNNDCTVEHYNLQGVRVSNPENGIFIRRQGNKTIKVFK